MAQTAGISIAGTRRNGRHRGWQADGLSVCMFWLRDLFAQCRIYELRYLQVDIEEASIVPALDVDRKGTLLGLEC